MSLSTIQAKITRFFYGDSTPTISCSTPNTSNACTPGASSSIPTTEPTMWTSLSSECPILKISHETLFIPRSLTQEEDSGADSSSIESLSPGIAKIRTVSTKRRSILAVIYFFKF